MKITIAQPFALAREDTQLSQSHDFNMEAVVANHFGQGDDHRPTDPLSGSPYSTQLRWAISREQRAIL